MWQNEMVKMLRYMIGDLDTPYAYDDSRLEELIVVSAQRVVFEVSFSQSYIVDIEGIDITPDPTDRDANTRDDAFINLVTLKAACILDSNETREAAKQAITIRDGDSEIALGSAAQIRAKLLEVGPCQTYEEVRKFYLMNRVIGTALISGGCNTGCGPYGYPYSYPLDWRYR